MTSTVASATGPVLDADDLARGELDPVLARAEAEDLPPVPAGQVGAMVFERPGARTPSDVWVSMGEESPAAGPAAFTGSPVEESLFGVAWSGAVVPHCLPAHRGKEISAAVDGAGSVVSHQAAQRRDAMVGILAVSAGKG